jgi:hypothetical protein
VTYFFIRFPDDSDAELQEQYEALSPQMKSYLEKQKKKTKKLARESDEKSYENLVQHVSGMKIDDKTISASGQTLQLWTTAMVYLLIILTRQHHA